MNQNNTTIVIDAMGGDGSPFKTLKGTEIFLKNKKDVNIIFFGEKDLIETTIQNLRFSLIKTVLPLTINIKHDDKSSSRKTTKLSIRYTHYMK